MNLVEQWVINSTNHPCGEVMGDWDVGRVTNMDYLFAGKSGFNSDISNWNTSSVTSLVRSARALRVGLWRSLQAVCYCI